MWVLKADRRIFSLTYYWPVRMLCHLAECQVNLFSASATLKSCDHLEGTDLISLCDYWSMLNKRPKKDRGQIPRQALHKITQLVFRIRESWSWKAPPGSYLTWLIWATNYSLKIMCVYMCSWRKQARWDPALCIFHSIMWMQTNMHILYINHCYT